MSRARNIKPGFFKNELLVELPFEYRLLFIGLWTMADREGRLEDRPTKIRMELFPADAVDVDGGLQALADKGFIARYAVGERRYVQVLAWGKHQNPHHREGESTIPALTKPEANKQCMDEKPEALDSCNKKKPEAEPVQAPESTGSAVLIPDSGFRIPEKKPLERQAARFDEFWADYPVKKGRAAALAKWKARSLDRMAERILADVRARLAGDRQWIEGFIPHGSTYVSQSGWEDAIEPPRLRAVVGTGYQPLPGEI